MGRFNILYVSDSHRYTAVAEDPDELPEDEDFDLFVDVVSRLFRPFIVAIIYVSGLSSLSVPLYKSLAVGGVAFFAVAMPLGSRIAQAGAVGLLTYVLAWWVGAVPDPPAVRLLVSNLGISF